MDNNTKKISEFLLVLKTFFPKYFSAMSVVEMERSVAAWTLILGDYTSEQISAGLKFFLITNTKGFPPTPGEMIESISKVSAPANNELTAEECWQKVQKAVSNSGYHSTEEYNNLPEVCKKLVGSANMLQRYGEMSVQEFETVVKSNFLRSYQALFVKTKENEKIQLVESKNNLLKE